MKSFLEWHLTPILFFLFLIFVSWGLGYLVLSDMSQQERAYNTCIEADKQYIHGSCIK